MGVATSRTKPPVERGLRGVSYVLCQDLPNASKLVYDPEVPTVWKSSHDPRVKFHRAGCRHLGDSPVEVDLRDVHRPQACLECFPDSPRALSAHRFCPTCNTATAQPCPHNGGVRVLMARTRRKPSLRMPAGDVYARLDYVWPEYARHYA